MVSKYEFLQNILNELEEWEEAKKKIPVVKQSIKVENEFVGNKYNMLTVLEKTDKRNNQRLCTL